MFSITDSEINAQLLEQEMADHAAGALVVFQGRVRNENDGRQVMRLEYEAFDSLAEKEGNTILDETKAKFDIIDARCLHRTGLLDLGDAAVWIGVTAGHRGEAFAACRHIIDEIKDRVPIWKKEHYTDGDSGWINSQTGGQESPGPEPTENSNA
jgi:molybdopterin synthase catalytic subunit